MCFHWFVMPQLPAYESNGVVGKNCTAELIPQMNLCDTGSAPNDTDVAIMYAGALANYRYIPQFNYAISSAFAVCMPI